MLTSVPITDLRYRRFPATELNCVPESFHETSGVISVIKDKFNPGVFAFFGLPTRRSKRFRDLFFAIRCFRNYGILEGIVFHPSYAIGVKVFQRKVVRVSADILIVQINGPRYRRETTMTVESRHIMARLAVWGAQLTRSLIRISLPRELASVIRSKIVHPHQSIFQTGGLLGTRGHVQDDHEDQYRSHGINSDAGKPIVWRLRFQPLVVEQTVNRSKPRTPISRPRDGR